MNEEQKDIVEKVDPHYDLLAVADAENIGLDRIADTLLKLKTIAIKDLFGGDCLFTGKYCSFKSGTIGFEVKCRKCSLPYWITNLPYAVCVDCDRINIYR